MDIEEDLEDDFADSTIDTHLDSYYGATGESPWTTTSNEALQERAQRRYRERSPASRTADESYNAPIADSYAQWAANPDRYDLPGVDTISADRYRQRAQTFLERAQAVGAVREFVPDADPDEMGSTAGDHVRSERRIRLRADLEDNPKYATKARAKTLAHEVGHAVDSHSAEVLREQSDDSIMMEMGWHLTGSYDLENLREGDIPDHRDGGDPELGEELASLSERARGEIKTPYRTSMGEISADAVALAVLEPRATKRDHPEAFRTIQNTWLQYGLQPLEADR